MGLSYNGIIDDPRTEAQKSQDYQHDELGMGAPLNWVEKTEYKKFSLRNQDGSFSCGGQAGAKALETLLGKVISAHPIYRQRANYPMSGMYLADIGNVLKNWGTTTEDVDVSQNIDEIQMNRSVTVPVPLAIGGYVMVNHTDIDAVASAIQQYGNVILVVHANYSEWKDRPVYDPNVMFNFGHFVCGVDFTLSQGEKSIIIEDSWGQATSIGNGGQRIITESFLKARFGGAMSIFAQVPKPEKPKYTFSKFLTYGMTDPDVKALQDILRYEGFFTVDSTGKFYNYTANALKKWQVAHGIMDFANVTDLTKVRVGKKTITLLNSLYK